MFHFLLAFLLHFLSRLAHSLLDHRLIIIVIIALRFRFAFQSHFHALSLAWFLNKDEWILTVAFRFDIFPQNYFLPHKDIRRALFSDDETSAPRLKWAATMMLEETDDEERVCLVVKKGASWSQKEKEDLGEWCCKLLPMRCICERIFRAGFPGV
jgi:hypothetical protein|tara:strand:- start:4262 stop:4726 length:465 start_codon:yes stop_codon:yes gene_type:complete